jgi:prepilin-type N-terminal cleavage/methylation domain-containing protein
MNMRKWEVGSGRWTETRDWGLGIRDWGKRPATAVAEMRSLVAPRLPSPACGGGAGGEGGRIPLQHALTLTLSQRERGLKKSRAFTLIELLVTITIIGILAAMSMGALQVARESARETATKATIAKLNSIIMRRYESYMNRRVPISTVGLTPRQAAMNRLYAIRDMMRMEMPDRADDIVQNPITLPNTASNGSKSIPAPALRQRYLTYYYAHKAGWDKDDTCISPECLYLLVSMGEPEDMSLFTGSEIGDTNGNGWLEFLDGWGRPIFFLRWAPGFSSYSDIQVADATNHHDPFDPRRSDLNAYQLFPLIYSAGPDGKPGLNLSGGFNFATATGSTGIIGDIFNMTDNNFTKIGSPSDDSGKGTLTNFRDNITNHHIEAR